MLGALLGLGVDSLARTLFALLASLLAAPVAPAAPSDSVVPAPPPVAVPSGLSTSDTARILAGLPVDDAVLGTLMSRSLARHRAELDGQWRLFDERVGRKMASWAAAHVEHTAGETVFYPFAAADFPTVHRLYPDAARYVLVSLEFAGPVPDLREDPERTLDMLASLAKLTNSFVRHGYFITGELEDQVDPDRAVQGLTPLLLALAAREDFDVLGVQPVQLSADGDDLAPAAGNLRDSRTWASIRLSLRGGTDGSPVVLDYVRLSLADLVLAESPAAWRWVTAMSGHRVFVKAAAHLLQFGGCNLLRDAILEHAPTVLQDETGIDYAELTERFEVELFGNFDRAQQRFGEESQGALAAAYASSAAVGSVPFRFGYDKPLGPSLQLARRRR